MFPKERPGHLGSRKIPKTLLGIETELRDNFSIAKASRKIPKTLLGIETLANGLRQTIPTCRKIPKTLLGIETLNLVALH